MSLHNFFRRALRSTPPRVELGVLLEKRLAKGAKPMKLSVAALFKREVNTPTKKFVLAAEESTKSKLEPVLSRWAKKISKTLVRELTKQDLRTALAKVRGRTPKQIVDDVLKNLGLHEFSMELVEAVREDLERAFRMGGASGIELIGLGSDRELVQVVNDLAVTFSESRAAALVTQIEESTRDFLRMSVTNSLEEGSSADKLAEDIEQSGAFSESRAATIARTELANAHVQGNLESWTESGVVTGKQSIIADTHPHHDECDENADAGVIALDENFPSGDSGPPYHPNCLCDVVPVLAEDDDTTKFAKGDTDGHPFRGNQHIDAGAEQKGETDPKTKAKLTRRANMATNNADYMSNSGKTPEQASRAHDSAARAWRRVNDKEMVEFHEGQAAHFRAKKVDLVSALLKRRTFNPR